MTVSYFRVGARETVKPSCPYSEVKAKIFNYLNYNTILITNIMFFCTFSSSFSFTSKACEISVISIHSFDKPFTTFLFPGILTWYFYIHLKLYLNMQTLCDKFLLLRCMLLQHRLCF